jgi:hypothetical protein
MRNILLYLALCLFSGQLLAQFPNSINKMRLGFQTTGDGLVHRTAGVPAWTPSSLNNAWLAIDTLTGNAYSYQGGEWRLEVAGDLRTVYPQVINKSGADIKRGQAVMVDYNQLVQGDLIRIIPADGTGAFSTKLTMGIASTDINNNAEGYITWFGYVREVKESDIMQTGITADVGDILYLSPTQAGRLTDIEPTAPANKVTMALVVRKPNANNITLLVRPSLNEDLGELNDVDLSGLADGQTIVWDSINGKWIAGNVGSVIDTTVIATKWFVGSKVDSTRLIQDSILVYFIGGAEVGRDTISGIGSTQPTTFTISQNETLAFIIVDDNNATPWDGLSVVGVLVQGIATEATFTVNGITQTLTIPIDSANLTFTGSSSPVSLNSSTGSGVTFTAGNNITLTQSGNNMTIAAAGQADQLASIHLSGGSTTLAFLDAERVDNDNEALTTGFATSLFVADSSYIRYLGTDTIYVKVHGVYSFTGSTNATVTIGVSVSGNNPPIYLTASTVYALGGVAIAAPIQVAVLQIIPNAKLELVVENTTNVSLTLVNASSSLYVEKINQ